MPVSPGQLITRASQLEYAHERCPGTFLFEFKSVKHVWVLELVSVCYAHGCGWWQNRKGGGWSQTRVGVCRPGLDGSLSPETKGRHAGHSKFLNTV